MHPEMPSESIVSGFQALMLLCAWMGVVLLYAVYRSSVRPDPDEIRPSGPTLGPGDR